MSAKKKWVLCVLAQLLAISIASANNAPSTAYYDAKQLGWIVNSSNFCGGTYLEEPFVESPTKDGEAIITTGGGWLSQRSTSLLDRYVTVTRNGQQITANQAYLYRDPITGKISVIDMIGNVHLREDHSLIVGKKGRYNFTNQSKSLIDILYRTSVDANIGLSRQQAKYKILSAHPTPTLTAWGKADAFSQTQPRVFELSQGSYSTCPPIDPTWRVKASRIVLDKNTGRGYATHARVLVKNIPVVYVPYISFSIDKQRKSGFLWPTFGSTNKWGPYFLAPYYWNMAPNYDMTIIPGLLSKRGFQFNDEFRYLTKYNEGGFKFSILPHDKEFRHFQQAVTEAPQDFIFKGTEPDIAQAEINRLLSANDTRKSFIWRDNSQFNDHWSSHIDYNAVSDDYYLHDFGQNLNELTTNQLLQEGDLYYKGSNWNFIGRIQAYQTLHPVNEPPVKNQYRRYPQLVLNGDYPDQAYGFEYFIANEVTHFDILNTPGTDANQPIGNRLHTQPGISLPLYWPYFYINPRAQLALTNYNLYQTADTQTPRNKQRGLPIFDISSGLAFTKDAALFNYAFTQTLEPQLYYTYIPYRNQVSIPLFDTNVNTLTYDQVFNYNRFTSIDRIGDANQIALGITTRLIDKESGLEKVRLGIGEIIYFANRRVTLCNNKLVCEDNPTNPSNKQAVSPISGVLNYHINPSWLITTNAIWNPLTKQLDNTTFSFQYRPDTLHLFNFAYTYARGGDILSGISTPSSANNLKVTDISAAFPLFYNISAVGRWSQNWNHGHLQNLLYGLQYDTCCWAVRLVGGQAFIGYDPQHNNRTQYNTSVSIQISLKGLGDIATGNPSGLLSGIPGYQA